MLKSLLLHKKDKFLKVEEAAIYLFPGFGVKKRFCINDPLVTD